ncbi:MAG: Dam family site-specific DNA-(adenine-N6)-methyltransferase [Vampirovibrionales bacterium]|nr:Dam family site-specific DNA-(adenine-N6)-methyltransferase [Vampirovibrionales bacterium]
MKYQPKDSAKPEHSDASFESTILTPPLKWAGGKRWLVSHVQARLNALGIHLTGPDGKRLIEPFCGGLAMALGLQPQRAWLNDVNPHLINFYRHVQSGLVIDNHIDEPLQNDRLFFDAARQRFNALIDQGDYQTPEAAVWFYYLNRTGYNGLCRFNQTGHYNVPFGRYSKITYARDFLHYRDRLRQWQLSCGSYRHMMAQQEHAIISKEDVVYADPPYDAAFVNYSAGGFSWQDQEQLAQWLAQLPGTVMASNQATPRIQALYQDLGFEIELLEAPRRIACNGNRDKAQEILAIRRGTIS